MRVGTVAQVHVEGFTCALRGLRGDEGRVCSEVQVVASLPPNGGNRIIRTTTRRRHADSQLLMLQNPHRRCGERGSDLMGLAAVPVVSNDITASQISHAIRLEEVSTISENVAIPTLLIHDSKESRGNCMRNWGSSAMMWILIKHNTPHWCGGRRRDQRAWLRCPWAVAGPGQTTRRRAERSSQRGRLAGGRPPTGTPSSPAHMQQGPEAP